MRALAVEKHAVGICLGSLRRGQLDFGELAPGFDTGIGSQNPAALGQIRMLVIDLEARPGIGVVTDAKAHTLHLRLFHLDADRRELRRIGGRRHIHQHRREIRRSLQCRLEIEQGRLAIAVAALDPGQALNHLQRYPLQAFDGDIAKRDQRTAVDGNVQVRLMRGRVQPGLAVDNARQRVAVDQQLRQRALLGAVPIVLAKTLRRLECKMRLQALFPGSPVSAVGERAAQLQL